MNQDKVVFFFQKQILEKIPEDIRVNVCVAGGAVRDKLLGVEIKDYDLFVSSKEVEDKLMAFFKKDGKEGNVNAQTANYTYEGKWVQIVRGKYFNMETSETIDNFDFVHCCAMVTTTGIKVHPEFYRSIATKHIMVNKLLFPLSSLERLQKYVQKGYSACNGTLTTLSKAIQTVDFDKPDQNTLDFYGDGTPRFRGVD